MKQSNKPQLFRQGDVLIERIESVPNNVVKQSSKIQIILAFGEATGHHHSLKVDSADWWKGDNEQFLALTEPAEVTHQEHAPITLPAGTYRVTVQREYSPEAIRNVQD